MKTLVTGAGGFVGKHLCQLLKDDFELVTSDSDSCDITNYQAVQELIQNTKPELIYHLAALAFVPECQKNFKKAIDVNVNGTHNLIKASLELGLTPRVVFISTANVYGLVKPEEVPLTEESELRPNNNYALSKLMAEAVIKTYQKETGQDCVIFRAFNHIGPGQSDNYVISSFAKQVADIENGKEEAVIKVGNLAARRDFTDVRDIVKAYRNAARVGQGVYNLCSGKDIAIQEILDHLISFGSKDISIQIDPERFRDNDLPILKGDASKASKELDWKPVIPLEQSLKEIYQQYL